jgi:predicted ATP-grasp superfamily ATP-dependent carboligase
VTESVLDVRLAALRRDRPPVVLLGGLSLLRSLQLAAIPAVVAAADPSDPALWSRHLVGRVHLPDAARGERATVDALLAAGRELHGALGVKVPLFYGNDDQLSLIYGYRDELAAHYRLLLNEPALGRDLLEKDRFEVLARAHDLPVPRSWSWHGEGAAALRDAPGPKVVKPRKKTHWDAAVRQRLLGGEGKALVFASAHELIARVPAAHAEELSIQDYVPGEDDRLYSFHGYADEQGRLLAWFVGRKVRTFPRHTGESSFLELARDDVLAALGRELGARLGLKGVFKMDFKQDERDGRFYLLEINARFSLWNYLGAANGVNLLAVAYEHLVYGRRPPAAGYRTRYRWLKLAVDYRAFRELHAARALGAAGWLRSIVRSPTVYHCFDWRDPAPLLALWSRRANRLFRRWRFTAS